MFCNQCGHRNPPGSNFCSSCGAPLEVAAEDTTITFSPVTSAEGVAEEDVSVTVPPLEGVGMLVVKRGPNAGSRYRLEPGATKVGRHPDSDIFLDDITVSRRHAEFVQGQEGATRVRDVGSLNGTYVNRERIEDIELNNGDEVQIGKFKLVYLAGRAEG